MTEDGPEGTSSDLCNVRVYDGRLKLRGGWREITAVDANVTTVRGFQRVVGYDGSYVRQEEWLCAAKRSGPCRPFTISNTGTRSLIGSLFDSALVDAAHVIRGFGQYAYFMTPSDTSGPRRYTLGSAATLFSVPYSSTPGLVALVGTQKPKWGTIGATGTYTGKAQAAVATYDSITTYEYLTTIGHASGVGAAGFTVDISAASSLTRDFTRNDTLRVYFNQSGTERIDPNSINISLVDSTPTTYDASAYVQMTGLNSNVIGIEAYWDFKDRTKFGNIQKMVVTYTITATDGTAANRDILVTFERYYPDVAKDAALTAELAIDYAVSVFDASGRESDLVKMPVPATTQSSLRLDSAKGVGLAPVIYLPNTTTSYRVYMRATDGVYHQIVDKTTGGSPTTIPLYYTNSEALNNTVYPGPSMPSGVISAVPYKSWMVWLYKGGKANVRHSRVGAPERLDSVYDQTGDEARGATFTLADNFGDEPVGGIQINDILLLLGTEGIYTQIGDKPSTMTPSRKISAAPGCAGIYAYAQVILDSVPGCIYVDKYAEHVWFVSGRQNFTGDNGGSATRLSDGIPNEIKSWLVDATGVSAASISVQVDERTGDVYILNFNRAIVYARMPDGSREWMRYYWAQNADATGGWTHWSFGPDKMWGTGTGLNLVEFVRNSSTGATIAGTIRDGGFTMPVAYWQSQRISKLPSRVEQIGVGREGSLRDLTVAVISDRGGTVSVTADASVYYVRFPKECQGHDVKVKLIFGTAISGVNMLEIASRELSQGFRKA